MEKEVKKKYKKALAFETIVAVIIVLLVVAGISLILFKFSPSFNQWITGIGLGDEAKDMLSVLEKDWGKLTFEPDFSTISVSGNVFPVDGGTFSDDWGDPREGGVHLGTDIFAKEGTNVKAFVSGIVTKIGCNSKGGNRIGITSSDRTYYYYYAHLSSYNVNNGESVHAGQIIGKVGSTIGCRNGRGISGQTPPHLHFGIMKNGAWINPYPLLKQLKP